MMARPTERHRRPALYRHAWSMRWLTDRLGRGVVVLAALMQLPGCAGTRPVGDTPDGTSVAAASSPARQRMLPDSVRAYLDHALALMQAHALVRDSVDWPAFRAELYQASRNATTIEDVHLPLSAAVRRLGDSHSMFRPPPASALGRLIASAVAGAEVHPRGRMLDRQIGYLMLPGASAEPARAAAYADSLGSAVQRLQAEGSGVCGWIVDLRSNPGGNMWPMIAGIGPLLGADTTGWFVSPDGARLPWGYRAGASWMGGREMQRAGHATERVDVGAARIAVLTSARTASSGEAVATAFRGHPRARSFGAPTAGLSTSNTSFPMPDGAVLLLTTAVFADRDGREAGGALEPDVVIEDGAPAEAAENDRIVRTAMEWLREQPRCD